MEPISSSTTTEGGSDALIESATDAIASQVGGEDAAPAPPQAEPEGPPPPSYADRLGGWQKERSTGWAERQRRIREENQRYRKLEETFTTSNARTQELLQKAAEALRQRGGGEQQEEVPDPVLQPTEFQKWLEGQRKAGLEEALAPIREHIETQREYFERIRGESAAQEEEQQLVQEHMSYFQQEEAEYAEQQPELAQGAKERFVFGRDLLTKSFAAIGAGETAPHRANQLLFSVAHAAAAEGLNRVAALDGFIVSLINGVAEAAGVAIVPAGMAAGNGNGNGHHPPTEHDRVARVRQRTAAAGNAAPRLAAPPTPSGRSEAQDLYTAGVRAGNVNWAAVRMAALRDCNGNGIEAGKLINSLA